MQLSTTNIAALTTGNNHCTVIASVPILSQSLVNFSGQDLSFAKTTIINSTSVLLKFEEQIVGTVQMKNSDDKN